MLRVVSLLTFCAVGTLLAAPAPSRSTVYFAHNSAAISDYAPDARVVRGMVNALVGATTGQQTLAEAWGSLVQPADIVGIKVSGTGKKLFSTHKIIVQTIAEGLAQAGVPPQNIIVWDRANMAAAGFANTSGDFVVQATTPVTGYDLKSSFASPAVGKLIWGDLLFSRRFSRTSSLSDTAQLSDQSHWSKVLGSLTKIINVPVLSSSETCGVAGCLYNVTIPNVDNWRRFAQAPDPALCGLYLDKRVGPKVVFSMIDGLLAQFAGGPDFQPNFSWSYATIFASKDPVALDATAFREIEKWRAQAQLPSLAPRATYLQTAQSLGMGNAAKERIELQEVAPP